MLVLRRDRWRAHFRTPTMLPVLGALTCAFLVGPWTGRDVAQYRIAGVLLAIGVALWVVTLLVNRATGVTEPPIDARDRHPRAGELRQLWRKRSAS